MVGDWLSTGETADILGVSRQHIADLCDRGDLPSIKIGTHRRIRRASLTRLVAPQLTRNQEKSLWLHRAVLGALMMDPVIVLQSAKDNIARWKSEHRPDGKFVRYLDQWSAIIDGGVDQVAAVLTGTDEQSCELRQNSPFAVSSPMSSGSRSCAHSSSTGAGSMAPSDLDILDADAPEPSL